MSEDIKELLVKITEILDKNNQILETLINNQASPSSKPKEVVSRKNSLKLIITDILKEKGELPLAKIVTEVIKSGYKTKSSNFTSVVYQNIRILCNEGTICKNKELYAISSNSN